ncbi:hypothetical protein P879_01665 [Paragonimus westermani]|uniref:CP-type G domain-containing protein n=1 Tax=Paragonimus westermani TaxID=34504 RepID=A0A8T0DUA2_9TREM|nr:hypothetical protein P879_01665 [Paragonimus westermani]
MAKKHLKTKSKRITCHKRYKILKKVREHHRKVRKEAKKNLNNRKRKDPGVPNSLPFKEEVLKHVQEMKVVSSEVRAFNLLNAGKIQEAESKRPSSFAPYHLETDKIIMESNVVLEVLDARDPLGTRSLEIENKVVSANKRLVLILNKMDLVPRSNLQLWLNYLRTTFTVLPFKANTQRQSKNLARGKIAWNTDLKPGSKSQGSGGLGVDELMSLLTNYSRNPKDGVRNSLNVGVVGFPNTGKSAVINTLKRRKVCASSNVPGVTRQCQRIKLDKDIFLIDSPGIITSQSTDPSDLVLKNCLRPESLPDPTPAVAAILNRCPKQQLMSKYDIDDYPDVTSFLILIAHRLGRLKKGGIPDTTMAARSVINDWITGKITYFTQPPSASDFQKEDPVDPDEPSMEATV